MDRSIKHNPAKWGKMAELSEHDKRSLLGPDYQEISAQINAESSRNREKWKKLFPFALALVGVISIYVITAEAFF